jgi:hypothetical protein
LSVANRYVHDNWRHGVHHRKTQVEVLPDGSYCLDCNIDLGTVQGRKHFRGQNALDMTKGQNRAPRAAQRCKIARERRQRNEERIETKNGPPKVELP